MNEIIQDQLNRIVIEGYKSIKHCDLELKNINVLIGSNGAGKSNFISVFELLRSIILNEENYYASKKGINSLFYTGTKVTERIIMKVWYGETVYGFTLGVSENNNLIFIDHHVVSNEESNLPPIEAEQWCAYHFHDTSPTSRIKTEHNISNCQMLMSDARNLAAFLYRLKNYYSKEYENIIRTIKMVAPYFNDFILLPEEGNNELIFLRWQQKDWEDILNPSQLSDGTLRFACLATLLLQPTELQPATIIIDEPELGLHPFAITILSEMVQKAAVNKQVILSTQSVELLNHFEPEDVVVVDRDENGSKFKRLDSSSLTDWLEDYSLGELWNKNILGGRFAQ